jgi:hypothetical protein
LLRNPPLSELGSRGRLSEWYQRFLFGEVVVRVEVDVQTVIPGAGTAGFVEREAIGYAGLRVAYLHVHAYHAVERFARGEGWARHIGIGRLAARTRVAATLDESRNLLQRENGPVDIGLIAWRRHGTDQAH